MSEKKPFSYFKGYSFLFEDDGNEIEAWFSTLTGTEKVYINGELVSKQRSFSKKTFIGFKKGENEYTTAMCVKSLLKGPFICTLNKNGLPYKRQKLVFAKLGERYNMRFIIFAFILAALLAVLNVFTGLPDILAVGIILISVTIFLYYKNKKKPIAWIEDEEIV